MKSGANNGSNAGSTNPERQDSAKGAGDGSQSQEENRSNDEENKPAAASLIRKESWKDKNRAGDRRAENNMDGSVTKPSERRHDVASSSEWNAADTNIQASMIAATNTNVAVEDAQIAMVLSECGDSISVDDVKRLIKDCNGDVDTTIALLKGEKEPSGVVKKIPHTIGEDDLQYYTEAPSGWSSPRKGNGDEKQKATSSGQASALLNPRVASSSVHSSMTDVENPPVNTTVPRLVPRPRPPLHDAITPGAVRVNDGGDSTTADNTTLMSQEGANPTMVNATDPIVAHLAHDDESRMQRLQRENEQMRRERENAPIAQVIDREPDDQNDRESTIERFMRSLCRPPRRGWTISALVVLVIVAALATTAGILVPRSREPGPIVGSPNPDEGPTGSPSSPPSPSPSFGAPTVLTEPPSSSPNSPSPTAAGTAPPISLPVLQCFNAMNQADQDFDSMLNQSEYFVFVNTMLLGAFSGSNFSLLPQPLRRNFFQWQDQNTNRLNIFGSKKGENADAAQMEFLTMVCTETLDVSLPPTTSPAAPPSPTTPSPLPVTPPPTIQPTIQPTAQPTPLPSPQPTPAPSPSPTQRPTPQPTPSPTPPPTPAPSPLPTQRPTPEPTQRPKDSELLLMLKLASFDRGQALQNPSSPQHRAYEWLERDPRLESYTEKRKIQRFVLATLYYSTNGDSWNLNLNWLDYEDECFRWWGGSGKFTVSGEPVTSVLCNRYDSDGQVALLGLEGNNLVGTIPPELGLLSDSLKALDLGNNGLHGSVPEELEELSSLDTLVLSNNSLSGEYPLNLAYGLESLDSLVLYDNQFVGDFVCPSRIYDCAITCPNGAEEECRHSL